MERVLVTLVTLITTAASAAPFTGNDTRSNAMGGTGVASATSFAASQFNPALLTNFGEKIDFGLQLPSMVLAIDDGKGFEEAASVVSEFKKVDIAVITTQVGGNANTVSLAEAVRNVRDSADFKDGGDQEELEKFSAANAALSEKVTIITAEMNDLDAAVKKSSESFSTLNQKPLAFLGSIGTAISLPREKTSAALHLNSNINLGMLTKIDQGDLDKISSIVAATNGFANESQQVTQLNANFSAALATFNTFDTTVEPCTSGNAAYQAAFNNLILAQASLYAEVTNEDQTAVICDGEGSFTNEDRPPIGNTNLANYTSEDGLFVDGELQNSTLEGLGDDSTITVLGANMVELGLSVARDITFLKQDMSVGITPKLQLIQIFEDNFGFNENNGVTSSDFMQNVKFVTTGNVDVGVAKTWSTIIGGQMRAGLAVKDIVPQTFKSTAGRELTLSPKARIGVAHETRFSTLAMDLDLTENKPLGYGSPSQQFGIGAEYDAFNWAKVRAGYRNNLAIKDLHTISTGLGFTPFGIGLDLTAWMVPTFDPHKAFRDAGIAGQFSMNW
ncbi:conjugal transfer protein TraF [Saccharospirillum sp. HFRX-1]|uniref:conjugal transfer protein TraF n=1 Tax=unclassified Saccharospirillum TaxID=2633430 RepID=UPI0037191238